MTQPTYPPKSFGPPGRCEQSEQAAINRASHRWGMNFRADKGVTKRYCLDCNCTPGSAKATWACLDS
jgi:hypothetical protein